MYSQDERIRLERIVIEGLEKGLTLRLSCGLAGVEPRTAKGWIAEGLSGKSWVESDKIVFAKHAALGALKGEAILVSRLLDSNDWRAIAKALAVTRPRRYADTQQSDPEKRLERMERKLRRLQSRTRNTTPEVEEDVDD